MDGELIVLDGEGYQLKSDGTVNKVTANMTSPFAVMAFFEEHQKINISQPTSYEEIQKIIVENLPSLNLFYGIKINGLFSEIKTRTVSWQEKPYPTLVKASEQQGILNVKNTNGDIVGFWTPSFANTLGVNGFHCHFINIEKNTGSHVFDFQLDWRIVEICYFSKINLELPINKEYLEKNLRAFEVQKEIELAENAKK
ncbi:acetolactate decarboxylase [Spiroplasma citri]|uniref:Alpha-acetolactate decarboxylase n=1 Tax=Spiroplasma citri TaxID=2133 RepID=Q14QL0_SPICI|nr:acetolactate decarboxylase [Spiroplasma citri]WFG98368.1 acetolactate decarboxylase [Spiroplasma citri]CAK98219.1 probable alpha-acetolactate decarboxylase protein [Spiroplasma citri]